MLMVMQLEIILQFVVHVMATCPYLWCFSQLCFWKRRYFQHDVKTHGIETCLTVIYKSTLNLQGDSRTGRNVMLDTTCRITSLIPRCIAATSPCRVELTGKTFRIIIEKQLFISCRGMGIYFIWGNDSFVNLAKRGRGRRERGVTEGRG